MKRLLVFGVAPIAALVLAACEEDGPLEEAGEDLDDAVEELEDTAEEAEG
ncbi:hypothetical protein [Hyphobacterium sp.]|jgi:predicted small secreted protein